MKKHLLIHLLSCGFLLLLSIASVTAQTIPTPELLYYRFDGTGTTVPNLALTPPAGTATADLMGGVTQGGTGFCGGALIGSGNSSTTDYLNTHWAPNLTGTSWTISFWSSNIIPSATLFYIFGDLNSGAFRCFTNGVAGPNNWILRGDFTDVYINGGATVAPHMTTFVYDITTGNIYGYLDGVLVTTVPQSPPNITGTGPFKVMGYASNVGSPTGGLMDEYRIYSHALTATEVLSLYQRYTYDTLTAHSCVNPYLSPSGNHSWTVAGTYSDTLVGANMYCGDSVLSINLDFPSPLAATISISASPNDTICSGTSVTMTANATNAGATPGYQWYLNGVAVGANQNTYTSPLLNDSDVLNCVLTSSYVCPAQPTVTSADDTIRWKAPNANLAGFAGGVETNMVNMAGDEVISYTDCDLMVTIRPNGASPLNDSTTVKVSIDNAVATFNGQPYVQRHYDIEPVNNVANATATVSLYAYQSEFDAYNVAATAAGLPLLPTGGVDNGNVKITQFHGVGTAPANYPGPEVLITPIVSWDATNNWWVMDFPVTGFSGFYIHTAWQGNALDIAISNIGAQNAGARNRVDWSSATETKGGLYTIQRSADGRNFTDIGTVSAKGTASAYTYWDEKPFNGINYYRIKIDAPGGESNYTKVVDATVKNGSSFNLSASPNPAHNSLSVTIVGTQTGNSYISITDLTGRELKRVQLSSASASIDLSELATGIYMLKYKDDARTEIMKIVKE